jgi:hypothetical protein
MKAILEIEMPESCAGCALLRKHPALISECFIAKITVGEYKDSRPTFCPLKIVEMPEHTEIPKHNKLVMFPAMTLRDYFAGQALKTLSMRPVGMDLAEAKGILGIIEADARVSYAYADAMLAAREGGVA